MNSVKSYHSLVFISGNSWDEFVKQDFRTRQGALLKAFATSGIGDLIIIKETGLKGKSGCHTMTNHAFGITITQIEISARIPKSLLLPISCDLVLRNYYLDGTSYLFLNSLSAHFIWSYNACLGKLIKRITSGPLFYDIVDFRLQDPNISWFHRFINWRELNSACKYADVITSNSEFTMKRMKSHRRGDHIYHLRNGVDPERFINWRDNTNREGIGFIGVISKWLDFHLIEKLLTNLPELSFSFYGIIRTEREKIINLESYGNFHWLGEIEPRELPSILSRFRVAIVPYNPRVTWNISGDSMKIFEYLAANTPVVSTHFQAELVEKFSGLISVCEDADQFIQAVNYHYSHSPDETWKQRSWDFVNRNSWSQRIEETQDLLATIRVKQ